MGMSVLPAMVWVSQRWNRIAHRGLLEATGAERMTDGGGIFVALTSCRDEERVEEFLTWYEQVQFRNALAVDGVDAATLYRSTEPGEPGFLAIYSLTGDVADTAARFRAAIEDRHAAGDLTELLEVRFARAFKVEKRMTSSGSPVSEDVDGT
jgi:hypothetical protein